MIPERARRGGAFGGDKFSRYGTLVAMGPGDKLKPEAAREPKHVKVGDRILYDHPSNREYKQDGEDYVILHEEQHVLAVIEG